MDLASFTGRILRVHAGTCVSVWALAKAVEGHELELAKEKACGNDGVELFI